MKIKKYCMCMLLIVGLSALFCLSSMLQSIHVNASEYTKNEHETDGTLESKDEEKENKEKDVEEKKETKQKTKEKDSAEDIEHTTGKENTIEKDKIEEKEKNEEKGSAEEKDKTEETESSKEKGKIEEKESTGEKGNTEETGNTDGKEDEIKEEKEKNEEAIVTLLAVGDDLLHKQIIDSGLQKDGSYNYDHLFAELKEDISSADIAVINQETIFAGEKKGYSGYPRFNSPYEVGDAIRKAGFDVVLCSNNHTLDMGMEGVTSMLNYWKPFKDITLLGIQTKKEQYDKAKYITKNGITIALLNYTYAYNCGTSSSKKYMLNDWNKENIKKAVKEAREKADFVVVFPHWGTEYTYAPNKFQKEYAQIFADLGADLVIGTHPHVVQSVEWLKGKSGNETLVFYSIGNYVSSMDYTKMMLGGMAKVEIKKTGTTTSISKAKIEPLVTHYERAGNHNVHVYKLENYPASMVKKHKLLSLKSGQDFSIKNLQAIVRKVLGNCTYR